MTIKCTATLFLATFSLIAFARSARSATSPEDIFAPPARGFISSAPGWNWEEGEGILTGNGMMGAIVLGQPHDETLFLSHAMIYRPNKDTSSPSDMASRLQMIRKLCLEGKYTEANLELEKSCKIATANTYRDSFIGALELHIKQPESTVQRYQRAVNFMTAETQVSVNDANSSFQRLAFVSRTDDVIVLKLNGNNKQTAFFSFTQTQPKNKQEIQLVAEQTKSLDQGIKSGLLYFRALFAYQNDYNPNIGYEAVGKVVNKGGERTETADGISIIDADEILLLIKIQPLLKAENRETNFPELQQKISALSTDYMTLLKSHAKVHGDLMGRVDFSLDAPVEDRAKTNEQLNRDSEVLDAPLAKIERAFDAGRYNIICSTGYNPPNLLGLWAGTWLPAWSGSFTTNGNLPSAVDFLLMGNTPELMHGYFRYHDERWLGFRQNVKTLFGDMRGFHIPAQMTVSPLETDFGPRWPHCFSHLSTPWTLQFYYDYFQYTGDKKFLAERAYPLMKEACGFYEDFLTIFDKKGKVVFVPSYSPETSPGREGNPATVINATCDIASAKQLLRNTIATAKLLGLDADLQTKWEELIALMPAYEVAEDGAFREWLWPGLSESHEHRHASHLYPLYDEMPPEIVRNPQLVKAVEKSIQKRFEFREHFNGMAFGIIQIGLAAAHIGNSKQTEQAINMLAKKFWSSGMASFHDPGKLFNMDISGGFPYLCTSALVYADPGHIRLFPALPEQWKSGSVKGVRLRGGIVVSELTWNGPKAKIILLSDTNQVVTLTTPDGKTISIKLQAGITTTVNIP
jgi:hypothetical protein